MKTICKYAWLLCWSFLTLLAACGDDNPITPNPTPTPDPGGDDPSDPTEWVSVTPQPDEWDGQRRAGITYQLLVYSFADSDGDGTGDLPGLTARLDYLERMGISALWLSPIHPAMSYHGYDVTDYTAVNPQLGTMDDFDHLLQETHARGIKVYLDFVLNHTGKDHPWFLAAKADAGSPYRQYYTFSRDPEADIANERIPMIATEGAAGYRAAEWFNTQESGSTVSGRYRFRLDWSNPQAPTVTVDEWDGPADDASAIDPGTDPRYLYFGEELCLPFRPLGGGQYELIADFESSWGFLIRTSSTEWGQHKWGARTESDRVEQGVPFRLTQGEGAANILFAQMDVWYYHSAFQTDWFADLNYGPATQCAQSPAYQAVADAAGGWIARGVDGFRLDAVKHIYHNAYNDENPTFLKKFYDRMNESYHARGGEGDFYMVGEMLDDAANVAPYYKGLPALFEFSFWYRLRWALQNGIGRYFVKDILEYQPAYRQYRTDYIEATKLSNHDEDRAASELGRVEGRLRVAAAVLLTAQGEPYNYQGEELGYWGTKSNGDEYVRTPILWDRAGRELASGSLSGKVDRQMLTESISVEAQAEEENSLLNLYRTFARLRNTYPALAEGAMTKHPVYNENNADGEAVAVWYREKDGERMFVAHNFGDKALTLPLDDALGKAVGLSGEATIKRDGGSTLLTLGAYSSVVFTL